MTAFWGQASAGAILAFVAVLYFTGWIVPKPIYKDMERQRDLWEREWRYLRDREEERTNTKIEANTEALRTVQQSFESLSSRRAS